MVDGSMVADRRLDEDAECLAPWRWVLSEPEEETLSSLIQTVEGFSSNLKVMGERCDALPSLTQVSVIERHLSIRFSVIDLHMCARAH